MERAVKSLKQKDPRAAYPPADQARKILEEIQKAQPRQDQQDQKQQDQNKKDEDQKKQDQQKDQQKKDQQKDDQREDGPGEKRAGEERQRPAEEGSGTEEAGRAKQVGRAETGSKTATAAGLARSDRRGLAQGPRTAAGKARTRPHDEGPCVRQSSRGEGLVMRHANYAMTGLGVVSCSSPRRRAGPCRRPTGNRGRSGCQRDLHRGKRRLRRSKSATSRIRRPRTCRPCAGFRRRLHRQRVAEPIVHRSS